MRIALIAPLLLLLTPVTSLAQAPSSAPVEGQDYVEIPNGRPLEPGGGKIVVEEFFNYICPGCNAFEPYFSAWAAQLPDDVALTYVPAAFRPDFVQYAQAYYAAQSLGLAEETHQAVYAAIHRTRTLPAEGDRPNLERIAEFYAGYGADEQEFLATMQSFGVDLKIRRATEHMQRSRVPSTPSLVVNGRYLVRGRSYDDMLRITDYLIEQERASATASDGG